MKKILLLILSTVLVLILGCGCNNNSSKDNAEELVLSKTEKELLLGEEYELMIYSQVHMSQTITWTSSNTSVATVDNGKIVANQLGETVIKATAKDGKTATCTIYVVTGGRLPVLEFEFDYEENVSVNLNEKLNFDGWVKFNGAKFFDMEISYELSNQTIATIDSDGTFSPLEKGTTVVTVKAQWRNVQSELLTKTFTVTVM